MQVQTVEWTSKIGASMIYSDTGGSFIPSDVSTLRYDRVQHKATHQRLKDGLLKNATVDMPAVGDVANSVRRTDDKGRPQLTAIDLIMMLKRQDFSQAQKTYAEMVFLPPKQPDLQLQQRAVDEAERNARELMETEEKEKLNVRQSSDSVDKRKMRKKMVKLAKIQRAVEESERNARELIEANERKRLDAQSKKNKKDSKKMAKIQRAVEEGERKRLGAQSKKDNDSKKMVEKQTETKMKSEAEKVVETADCVICLEIIRDDDIYCINASCGHILYCSSCARQALEAPDKHTRCPVCFIETPRGLHCIPSYMALARGIQPRAYGKG
jgi:hypothetical protein